MYLPKHFEQPSTEVLHELMRAHPLATLVTMSADGLNANHLPMHCSTTPAPFGTLHGHVARANPVLKDLANGTEVLVIFHGPDAYITPSWYATKKETGKAAPTWNYVVVHAYGVMRVVEDAAALRRHIELLTDMHESAFPEPWKVSDAPDEFVEQLMARIVGIEMVITRLVGKWKLSQNQPVPNRTGVVAGLRASNTCEAQAMAALVEAALGNKQA